MPTRFPALVTGSDNNNSNNNKIIIVFIHKIITLQSLEIFM